MTHARAALLVSGLLLIVTPFAASLVLPVNAAAPALALERVGGSFSAPVLVTHADDGSGRLFVVEQAGRIKLANGATWLDITSKVRCCGEHGLLGVAFAPDFEDTGRMYVSYSRKPDGAATLERLVVADPANGSPPQNGEVLLTVPDIFSNHNGGMLAFGPEGYLYWSTGDGGSGGDPQGNGQNTNVLLGKLLRIDVSNPTGYRIPGDNPFATSGGRPEIWAYGLRNPWRFSFDRQTGDLLIGDVGQNVMEEIDFQAAGAPGGVNYGWNDWEGILPYAAGVPDAAGKTFPVMTYLHTPHCSVTGGYVYRGSAVAGLQGWYLFGDYCSGYVWAALTSAWIPQQVMTSGHNISSFGEDEAGEMYLVDLGGGIYRIKSA